jgi:hypothetical protein
MAETSVDLTNVYLFPAKRKRGADEWLTEEDTDGTEIILTEEDEDIEGEDR